MLQVDRPDRSAASTDHRYRKTLAVPACFFAPNPSNPMESEMLPINQVFRTVQFLLFLDLVEIDREVLIADRLQITPKTSVADQRLVAFCKLALQGGEDRGAVGGILFGFVTIAADDVAPPG